MSQKLQSLGFSVNLFNFNRASREIRGNEGTLNEQWVRIVSRHGMQGRVYLQEDWGINSATA